MIDFLKFDKHNDQKCFNFNNIFFQIRKMNACLTCI